jgi:ATP dependent DNA ligase domain
LTAKLHNRKREFDLPDTLLPAVFNAQHFNGALIWASTCSILGRAGGQLQPSRNRAGSLNLGAKNVSIYSRPMLQMPVPAGPPLPRTFGCVCFGAFLARSGHVPSPPCQSALADRPPAGPGWLHEIKFDGYRVIARKDGEQVHLWARTTSDYSNTFTRIRDAVAALPFHNAVLDGEAIVLRRDATSDFEALRSRQGRQRRSRHLQ